MALTELGIKALKPKEKRFLVRDERGLYLEVYPTGGMLWHYRYYFGGKGRRVTLGRYPALPLKLARTKRDECATQVALGRSPAQEKQASKREPQAAVSFKVFAEQYFNEQVKDRVQDSTKTTTRRYLDKDIYPFIGEKPLDEVSFDDVQSIIFRKRDGGFEAAAGQLRGLLKRVFDYAVGRQKARSNPVAALPARFVTKAKSRTRSLTADELKVYLQVLYQSNIRRQFKLALHLILLTMVRKSELLLATWDEVNFDTAEWQIPVEHSKTKAPHIVYLSSQALDLFRQLRALSTGSNLVLPGRGSLVRPFAHDAMNHALKGVNFGIDPFTIHDLRRTASTHLHEAGFSSDVVEKALNHTVGGVRGVYNRAQYGAQRKDMLQSWADYVAGLATEKNVVLQNFKQAV